MIRAGERQLGMPRWIRLPLGVAIWLVFVSAALMLVVAGLGLVPGAAGGESEWWLLQGWSVGAVALLVVVGVANGALLRALWPLQYLMALGCVVQTGLGWFGLVRGGFPDSFVEPVRVVWLALILVGTLIGGALFGLYDVRFHRGAESPKPG
jgi:hypothetical protein